MKKTDQLINWLTNKLNRLVPKDEVNLNENKSQILQLLTTSNYAELTTKQQFDLFKSVESDFKSLMETKKEKAIEDLKLIDNNGIEQKEQNSVLEIERVFEHQEFIRENFATEIQ